MRRGETGLLLRCGRRRWAFAFRDPFLEAPAVWCLHQEILILRGGGEGRWPRADIDEALSRFSNLREIYWLQEEPENMGAWPFVHLQMHSQFRGMNVAHVARAESASPATGSGLVHTAEQADLLTRAFA